jgi:secondary thiamine-phosphate synthase enzyme
MLYQKAISTTKQCEMCDITGIVEDVVAESRASNGFITVFVPHTTCGITINEHADPDVARDILMALDKMVPESGNYRHSEGNSPAHIKASLMGSSVQVILQDSRLQLGTWQGIFLCEFDGPRRRRLWIGLTDTDKMG